jgi:tRNA(Arg) A34 adenosine deaminase TadA
MKANEFMRKAVALSLENAHSGEGGPFGAVIVKDGKIVGRGKNSVKKNKDPTAHGEVMAIRDAGQNLGSEDLSDCELYTSSEPCPMCDAIIKAANIARVYYSNTCGMAAQIGFADVDLLGKRVPIQRLIDLRAPSAFGIWYNNPKKEMYFEAKS